MPTTMRIRLPKEPFKYHVIWFALFATLHDSPVWATSNTSSSPTNNALSRVVSISAECHRANDTSEVIVVKQARALFDRLHHEVSHIVNTVAHALSIDENHFNESVELAQRNDYGKMHAVVGATRHENGHQVQIRITYSRWTGGHGGFGYAALDGVVFITLSGDTSRNIFDVSGSVGLADGDNFIGVPTVEARYSAALDEGLNDLHGSVAGFDVHTLIGK